VNQSISQKVCDVQTSQLSKQLGACIRDLRQQTGLSQVEFGERCGFYQTYLSRIENGRANPTINAIEVIANALGMTVFELYELFDRVRELQPKGKRKGT
jgi:transcriptional regulator with XRE-family HTH domain